MVKTDPIVLEVVADLKNVKAEIKSLTGGINELKQTVGQTSTVTEGFNKTVKAISFQTAAQGFLNVTTASAQLITSLSNLDRVQYQVRASATAVERAEDQVARKRLQLSKALDKYGEGSERATMATDELATAMDQLANKQDRLKLAQDQVNDTYILFGTNVANTVFGVVQTLISLKTMFATRALAAKVALDQETASLGRNTIALNLNSHAAKDAAASHGALSASGMGIMPIWRGLETQVTKQTGLLSKLGGVIGGVGRAGIIGSVAALGIGLGAYVYDQLQANDATVKAYESAKDLSESYLKATSATNELANATSNLNPFYGELQSSLDTTIEKYDELIKKQNEYLSNVDIAKPVLGISGEERAKGIAAMMEARNKADAELKQKATNLAQEKANIALTLRAMGRGDLSIFDKNVEGKIGAFEKIKEIENKIKGTAKALDDITHGQDDYNEALDIALRFSQEKYDLDADQLAILKQRILAEKESNEVNEKGNKIKGNTLKLEQEIQRLKKKLSPRTLFEEATQSFSSGSFTKDFLARAVGDKWAEKLGYQPIRGSFIGDQALGTFSRIEANIELVKLDQKMNIIVSEMEQQILAGNWDRVEILRDRLKQVTSGPNITKVEKALRLTGKNESLGGYGPTAIKNLKTIADKIHYSSAFWKGQQFTTSELNSNQIATAAGLGSRTLADIRSGKAGIVGTSVQYGTARARGVTGTPGTPASSSRARGKSSKHGGWNPTRWIREESERYVANALQVSLELTQLGSYFGLGAAPTPSGVNLNFGRVTAEGFAVMMTRAEKDFRAAQIEYSMRINQYQQSITGITSRVGITSLGEVSSLINNPLTYNDIDDRLRYNDRMEQISTGATVI